MARGNATLVNFAGGELSPLMTGRVDLPIYQRGLERCQNYISLPQGGCRYRNGFRNSHNTRLHKLARAIGFTFSAQDTYNIELTDQKLRFYRQGNPITETAKVIAAITKANPGVVTSNGHGFANGDEVFIAGIKGMIELNNQFFIVANVTANTFELKDTFNDNVNTTTFTTYVSGGTASRIYEILSPYLEAHFDDVQFTQSADTMYLVHKKYGPFKLTRTAHTSWTIGMYDRTVDPFGQTTISSITKANPGVVTTSTSHGLNTGDEVFIGNLIGTSIGMVEVLYKRYTIDKLSNTTFNLRENGVLVDTTAFTNYTASNGRVIPTAKCPYAVAFIAEARLVFGGGDAFPDRLAFSRAPDSTTGATRFDDFTTGANATDAILFFLVTVTRCQESIRWISATSKQMVVGTYGAVRRVIGETLDSVITPSTIQAPLVNSVGSALIQPVSNGESLFYVEQHKKAIRSFIFDFESSDYATTDQNLASDLLVSKGIRRVVENRGRPDVLWALRVDGVLTGMTYKERENIFAWHRQLLGGISMNGLAQQDFGKVISITSEQRVDDLPRLWAVVERKIGTKTARYMEYLEDAELYPEPADFYTGKDNKAADEARYANAAYERMKDDVYVDNALTYDGRVPGAGLTMTPEAITGSIQITASGAFFDTTQIGREIWKAYGEDGRGGGRAVITGISSTTVVFADVLVDFDNTETIPSGSWFITNNIFHGLLHMRGQTVQVQTDGAPAGSFVVDSSGAVTVPDQASVAHVGLGYTGILITMNLDVAGERGSAQAKIRRMWDACVRFINSVGCKVGTTLYNHRAIDFRTPEDPTDRAIKPFIGVQRVVLEDTHTRQNKQITVLQEVPSPQTVISIDTMVETSDD